MKIFLFASLTFLLTENVPAAVVKSTIDSLVSQPGTEHQVRLSNGRVVMLDESSPLVDSVTTHQAAGHLVEFEVNDQNQIQTMTVHYPEDKQRGGTRCSDPTRSSPKACKGFTVP